MNTALKATSVRDLKDAARAINSVLRNKIKGEAAIVALCDLLAFTARAVREEALRKPQFKRIDPRLLDPNYFGPVVVHGYRTKKDGTVSDWSRRFRNANEADAHLVSHGAITVEYILPADCDR